MNRASGFSSEMRELQDVLPILTIRKSLDRPESKRELSLQSKWLFQNLERVSMRHGAWTFAYQGQKLPDAIEVDRMIKVEN